MKIQQAGFTLIETIMAMAIFTIGILGLFGMQSAAIKENRGANNITTGATLASDRVEELIALNYDNEQISEGGEGILEYAPCATLSEADWRETLPLTQRVKEKFSGETANQADYFVYWAVSRDCTLVRNEDMDVGLEATSPYRPKHLYIMVTRDNGSGEEPAAQFSYIKQNPNY